MNNIKMSKVFSADRFACALLSGTLVLTGSEVEAAVLAIQQHDKLINENQRLRELCQKMADTAKGATRKHYGYRAHQRFESIVRLHKKTIARLNHL